MRKLLAFIGRTAIFYGLCLWLLAPPSVSAGVEFPARAKRLVFLGDSITHNGGYVAFIETQLRLQGVDPLPEIINIGLGSETCSGLSEADHPFPRPDVHERLDRALEQLRPDVVVACYGMNDGIYSPLDEARFAAYRDGVNRLIDKVHRSGAKLVLMTPPPFDPVPLREKGKVHPEGRDAYGYTAMFERYDEVLAAYAKWILQQADRVEMVIDLHGPLVAYATAQRRQDPKFTLSPDGIHPNALGHRLMAETILRAWGLESITEPDPELLKLAQRKTALLHAAWLSQVGHQRPGIKPGLPLPEAMAEAEKLNAQMTPLVEQARQPTSSSRPATGGTIYQVHYPASVQPGELAISVDYNLWVPEGVERLRGVIVHQHGCGEGASLGGRTAADDLHWQALARKWDCALLGPAFEPRPTINCRTWCDPRNGSDARFRQALEHFAEATGHPELRSVPWCLWGHSGGGFWASLMQTLHPERIVAIWLRSGTAFATWTRGEIPAPEIRPEVYRIPVMANPGQKEKDHERFRGAWDGTRAMTDDYRQHGAPIFFAPDPRTAHECGDCRYLAIPFFDVCLAQRLPPADAADQALRPFDEQAPTWRNEFTSKWNEYKLTGEVSDATPPPAPAAARAERLADGGVRIAWEPQVDFESGLRAFVIERDGKPIATVPEKPMGRFGRPLFQAMSYHDTPEAPLPEFSYVDRSAPAEAGQYRVRAINGVEQVSEPSAPVAVPAR